MNEIEIKRLLNGVGRIVSQKSIPAMSGLFNKIIEDSKNLSGEYDEKINEMCKGSLEAIEAFGNNAFGKDELDNILARYKGAVINYAEANAIKELNEVANSIGKYFETAVEIIVLLGRFA